MTKHLILITALVLFLSASVAGQQPREAALTRSAIPTQDLVTPEALPYDINGKVKLDAGAEDAVLLSLSGQVNLTPALVFQSNTRELVFTNSDPTICSTLRLYVNRTNKTIWANVDGVCAKVGEPGGGGGGGSGDIVGPSSSSDNELLIASGTTGKLLKRTNTLTGYIKVVNGQVAAAVIPESDLPFFIDATKIADGSITNTEFQFLNGVTAAIQTQINTKAPLVSPAFTTPNVGAATGTSLVLTGDVAAANFFSTNSSYFINAGGTVFWKAGGGSPEGLVTASVGSLWSRTDGGTNTTLYRKEIGSGNTGWVAITASGAGDALTANPLSQFATTTSAQLAAVLADEVGTGNVVFSSSPSFIGTPLAPTAAVDTNTTQIATTAFVIGQGYVKNTRLISTTLPLSGGGDLSANRTLSIADAAADASTKGAATFTAADFNASSGVISIDYANGQTANGSTKGFLAAADYTTFNSKVSTGAITGSGLTMATARILGRTTASTGAIEEITIGSGLSLSAGVLSNTASGGTVTVVSSGTLTSTALVTGGGTTTIQTVAATATMDSSGNISTPGTITSGAGSSTAGTVDLGEGTAASLVANTFSIFAPTDVAAGGLAYVLPAAAATGFMLATDASGIMTISHVASTGSGNVARATSPTFVTPTLGAATATSVNGLTITSSTGTLTITNGKTAAISNTLTFTGTDSSSVAFGAGGTVAYTIANGTSALGTSAISSGACATVVTTTATGTATTDTIGWGFNGDPTGVTGYQASANGMLTIIAYPGTNNVNFKVCNNTGSSITPGAITLNWRVAR